MQWKRSYSHLVQLITIAGSSSKMGDKYSLLKYLEGVSELHRAPQTIVMYRHCKCTHWSRFNLLEKQGTMLLPLSVNGLHRSSESRPESVWCNARARHGQTLQRTIWNDIWEDWSHKSGCALGFLLLSTKWHFEARTVHPHPTCLFVVSLLQSLFVAQVFAAGLSQSLHPAGKPLPKPYFCLRCFLCDFLSSE